MLESNPEIKEILDIRSKNISLLRVSNRTNSTKEEEVTFWTNWTCVKSESLQIILAYFLQYLVFPGIFYSLEVSLKV
jgi:hypothetical protein